MSKLKFGIITFKSILQNFFDTIYNFFGTVPKYFDINFGINCAKKVTTLNILIFLPSLTLAWAKVILIVFVLTPVVANLL